MARRPRLALPGIPQHVIQRGNNRAPCFYTQSDYLRYRENLDSACRKYGCRIHAFVLMTNHVHLLVTPESEHSISEMMQSLGRRYVRAFNMTHNRTGTLWEGRFRASLVESETYLLTCMRYIELNPVRAKMVGDPARYRWSSYTRNALGCPDPLLDPHPVYQALGDSGSERQRSYRALFDDPIHPDREDEIQKALRHDLVLGREEFKETVERRTGRRVKPGRPGRPRVEDVAGEYQAG